MHLDKYDLLTGFGTGQYEFWSEGPKGKVLKVVWFQPTAIPSLYNLAFGDLNRITGDIDDKSVTDNKDREKVLATVVSATFDFTDELPDTWIYATGSTPARTRLYQMGISRYWNEIQHYFEVRGKIGEEWELFERGRSYSAFLAKRIF